MKRSRHKTRFVGFVAASVDGRISLTKNVSPDWTSKEDWAFFQKSLARVDAVMVGRNTYRAAMAPLNKRVTYVLTTRPVKPRGSVTFVDPRVTDLAALLAHHATVAVLGGAQVYETMRERGLLDELYVTIEPLVFGRGRPMFEGGRKTTHLRLLSVRRLNKKGTLLLHYAVSRS